MAALASGVVAELDTLVRLRDAARDVDFLPRQPTASLLSGRRASKLRGRGMDFDELRAYVPGDDVRRIDWRATARLGKTYVRSYREERDRPLLLLVDQRAGMFFGSRQKMKSVVAAELAALIAWRVLARGDRVGALLCGNGRTWAFRPARSEAQVHRVCAGLVESTRALVNGIGLEPPDTTHDDFAEALRAASRLAAHDALLVVISDFRGLSEEAASLLRRIRTHSDLFLAWITDPLERELPELGAVAVTDGTQRLTMPSHDAAFRARFAAEFAAERARFEDFARRAGGAGFELASDSDPVARLRQVLGRRVSPGSR